MFCDVTATNVIWLVCGAMYDVLQMMGHQASVTTTTNDPHCTQAMLLNPGKHIPHDVIKCVADHCGRPELRILVALNRDFYNILTPNLYANVKIERREDIPLFFNTLANGRAHLAELPLVISIVPRESIVRVVESPIHSIREALLRTINLVDLEISLPSRVFEIIFQDVSYPFALRRLACTLVQSTGFSHFLASQSKIQELALYRDLRGIVNILPIKNINSESLPNLSSVSANLGTLLSLVPRRPIVSVDTGPSALSQSQYTSFVETLTRSSTPIEVIGVTLFCEPATGMRQIELFIDSLQLHRVNPKHLSITFTRNYYQVSSLTISPHSVHGLTDINDRLRLTS